MNATSFQAALLLGICLAAAAVGGPATNYEGPPAPAPAARVDQLVFQQLKQLNLEPAAPCSDPVFVRRVYLDVIGTLPTAAEAQAFILDRDPDKRAELPGSRS